MNKQRVALTLGSFVALVHLVWSLLVGFGFAQPWMNWVLGLHFLSNPFQFKPFELGTAIVLIIVTGVVGYIVGWVFATVWNRVNKK